MSKLFQNWGVLIAFVLFFIVHASINPGLVLSPSYVQLLFSQNAAKGLIAIGMTLVIIAGGIDLSVGSMLALLGCIGIKLIEVMLANQMPETQSVAIAAVLFIVFGLALGAANGLLVTVGRLAPFVATLIGLLMYRSAGQVITNGSTLSLSQNEVFGWFHTGGIQLAPGLIFTYPMISFCLLALMFGFLLNKTAFGKHVVAVGSNERAAHYSAVAVNKVRFWTYALLGGCVGLAALFESAKLASVSSGTAGTFWELDAIAAVVIGGTSLAGGRGRIWGTFIGVLLLGMISILLDTAKINNDLQGVIKGVIILAAVLLQRGRKGA